ncbi:lysophospholipid acyltransferase family protein [Sulfurimonas sp.]
MIRILYLLNKKEFHSKNLPDEPTIYACWHGELLMFAHSYLHHKKIPHAKVLISSHFDGLLIAKTIEKLGLEIIAGSSNRNAARALIQAIKALKDGYDIGITPDGPKGPRHEVADGIIIMAQKTNSKIVLTEIKPSKYWQLSSWDKFVIPKPFGKIHFYQSEAFDVSGMSLEDARAFIKKGLLKHEQ